MARMLFTPLLMTYPNLDQRAVFTVSNVGEGEVDVVLSILDADGTAIGEHRDTISPGRSKALAEEGGGRVGGRRGKVVIVDDGEIRAVLMINDPTGPRVAVAAT